MIRSLLLGLLLAPLVAMAQSIAPDAVLRGALTGADHQTYRLVPFTVPAGTTAHNGRLRLHDARRAHDDRCGPARSGWFSGAGWFPRLERRQQAHVHDLDIGRDAIVPAWPDARRRVESAAGDLEHPARDPCGVHGYCSIRAAPGDSAEVRSGRGIAATCTCIPRTAMARARIMRRNGCRVRCSSRRRLPASAGSISSPSPITTPSRTLNRCGSCNRSSMICC